MGMVRNRDVVGDSDNRTLEEKKIDGVLPLDYEEIGQEPLVEVEDPAEVKVVTPPQDSILEDESEDENVEVPADVEVTPDEVPSPSANDDLVNGGE